MPADFGTNTYFADRATNVQDFFGAVVPIIINVGNVAAGAVVTADLGHWVQSYPYGYLWDVVASVDASGATLGATVTLYDAITGGAQLKRLNSPLVIPASVATPTAYSARTQAILNPAYNPTLADNIILETVQGTTRAFSSVTSVRVASVTGAALTNLVVTLLFSTSNNPYT